MTRIKRLEDVRSGMLLFEVDVRTGQKQAYLVRRIYKHCDTPDIHAADCVMIGGGDGWNHHYRHEGLHRFLYAEEES